MKVPQYQQQVNTSHLGDDYLRTSDVPDAWGASIAHASQRLGESINFFQRNMNNIHNDIIHTNAMELANYIDQLEREELADTEKGYYSKLGKDAMRNPDDTYSGANGVLKKIDEKINLKQKELGLTSGSGYKMAELIKARKMDMLYRGATAHELQQTKAFGQTQNQLIISNSISKGVLHRDNNEDMTTALNNGKAAILQNARVQHWDSQTAQAELNKFESDFHSAILQSYIQDNSLKASEYFEQNKDKLLPDTLVKMQDAVKNNEMKYTAKSLADNLFAMFPNDEQAAVEELKKKNFTPDEYDYYYPYVHRKYSEAERLENQHKDGLVNGFYEKALPLIQQNQSLSYDLIPDGLDAKTKLSLMSFINQNGNPKTDDDVWEKLYNMKVNNAQGFAALNLNYYRGYLSDGEYKQFLKDQQTIKSGNYYSYIKDDDKMITEALNTLGLKSGKKDSAFSEIRSLVREFEARRGRKITDDELRNITNSLGYKGADGTKIYKELEKGMAERTGFIRDVVNDLVYYQSKHNGELPPDSEKYKIIQNRINNKIKDQNEKLIDSFNDNQNKIGGTFNGRTITSPYGKRIAPKKGASTDHKGIDLRYKMNEPFIAFEGGTVVAVGSSKNLGNYISIKDDNGIIHKYGHANSISVVKGQTVRKGEVIGRAGSTGISTGPHVHYATLKDGDYVNPFSVLDNSNNIAVVTDNNKGWAF